MPGSLVADFPPASRTNPPGLLIPRNKGWLAASPIGISVTLTAEVIRVDGRRVEFRVEARDEKEKIGEGTHERAIINIAKFATRLAEKSQRK